MNLKLVLPKADDAALWLQIRKQNSTQSMNPVGPLTLETLREQTLESNFPISEKKKTHRFMITLNGEGAGFISLKDINWDSGVAELGYLIAEKFQNRGLATLGKKITPR